MRERGNRNQVQERVKTLRTRGMLDQRDRRELYQQGVAIGFVGSHLARVSKEETLVEMFGVARATVRRALAELEAEQLVQRRHGTGTFVRESLSAGASRPTLELSRRT